MENPSMQYRFSEWVSPTSFPEHSPAEDNWLFTQECGWQVRIQDFSQEGATGYFPVRYLRDIFQTRFFPYNAHRRNVKVR